MHPTFRPTKSWLGPRAKQMGWANFALSSLATQTSRTTFNPPPFQYSSYTQIL